VGKERSRKNQGEAGDRKKAGSQNARSRQSGAGNDAFAKKSSRRGNPGGGETADRILERAVQAGKKRNYHEAVRILEELLAGLDAPPEAYLFLGRSLHALKDYSRALASFNDYVRLKPRSSQGYFFAGRTYLTIGMPNRAVPALRKALDLSPRDTFVMAFLGTAYLKARHSRLAVDLLQQAVEIAAADRLAQKAQDRLYHAYINALFIRGLHLCRIEEYDLGSQMLRFVLENGRDGPLLRLELGRACREMDQLEDALEHYTQAVNFAPGDLRVRWYRASILMSLGKNDEALGEIEYIRSADSGLQGLLPADLPWNSQLVDLYMIRAFLGSGEWRRAAEVCRAWIKHRGPDAMIHGMYAEALRNLKDYTAALNHLERAVEIEPDQLNLWYERILIAWEGENWGVLKRALRITQNLQGDPSLIRRFSILLEARTGEDDQRIISLVQDAIHSLGPEPELMYALGERYLKIGFADFALNWFRKTILVQEDHERSWLGKIAALEALTANIPGEAGDRPAGRKKTGKAGKTRSGQSPDPGLLAAGERFLRWAGAEQIAHELRESYDQYVRRWPDNYAIRRERALYLIHTFEYEEAVKELEALLVWEPSNPSLRRVLAYGYRKTGRYREAAVFLKSLLKEKPRNVELLLEYTGCLERAGAPQYAKAVLEKALVLLTNSPDIPLALGLLYSRERKLEKAFDLFREAAARNTRDPRPYQWMAALAKKTRDAEGAKRYEYEARKRANI
jgi:tetratricopeptide (TPR) repeat protein